MQYLISKVFDILSYQCDLPFVLFNFTASKSKTMAGDICLVDKCSPTYSKRFKRFHYSIKMVVSNTITYGGMGWSLFCLSSRSGNKAIQLQKCKVGTPASRFCRLRKTLKLNTNSSTLQIPRLTHFTKPIVSITVQFREVRQSKNGLDRVLMRLLVCDWK